jgi:hypothetical protein
MRIDRKAAHDRVSDVIREFRQERRYVVRVAGDHQRQRAAPLRDLPESGSRDPVAMASEPGDVVIAPSWLQATPASEPGAPGAFGNPRGQPVDPVTRHPERRRSLPGGDRYAISRESLQGEQQRPQMRPGSEHGAVLERSRQHERLSQSRVAASEYRDGAPQPLPGMDLQ